MKTTYNTKTGAKVTLDCTKGFSLNVELSNGVVIKQDGNVDLIDGLFVSKFPQNVCGKSVMLKIATTPAAEEIFKNWEKEEDKRIDDVMQNEKEYCTSYNKVLDTLNR